MPKHFCLSLPKMGSISLSGVNHCLFSGSWRARGGGNCSGTEVVRLELSLYLEVLLLEIGPELLDYLGPGDLNIARSGLPSIKDFFKPTVSKIGLTKILSSWFVWHSSTIDKI